MNENMVNLILIFSTYAFLGWVLETAFKSIRDRRLVNSGFLFGPIVPIYGFAAILLTQTSAVWSPLFAEFHSAVRILTILLSIAAVSSLLEYCTAALLESLFQAKWWDYSDERFHIKGRVSLKYSIFWGLLGYLLLQFIQPWLMRCLQNTAFDLKYCLSLLLVVYLPLDIVKCLKALGKSPSTVSFNFLPFLEKFSYRSKQMRISHNSYQKELPGEQYSDHCDYTQCIDDLIFHPLIQEMKQYRHHYSTSCFYHSLNVSYSSYRLCKALGWDYKSAARGGMLHDLFLYDWRTTTLENGRHGFVHPQIALENASGVSALNDLEKDIILKHMFPLTWRPPSYKESLLVCLVDKYWAVKELFAFGISSDRYAKSSHIPFPEPAGQ
ncbi:MAG: hypothetical protein PHX14_07195 [Syntrophomonadaceae bacterium]|nr:hypothetical protein [Syntrophomonadaceae bacterium]